MAKYNKRSMKNGGLMIQEDPSAPDYCPRRAMEKAYPENQYNDLSYGKDLYRGAQSMLGKNKDALRREMADDPQYY